MGWTMIIFKEFKSIYLFSSKKLIVLLIVLPDVIPFWLAAGGLRAGLGPEGQNAQLPQIIINGHP